MRTLPSQLLLYVGALLLFPACNPYAKIEKDKKRFPPLSATRPLGSACSENDSAMVKRALMHPLGPTGGWYDAPEVDEKRSVAVASTTLVWHHSGIKGYARFDGPGTLRSRSYDDIYGNVYCGFSPNGLALKGGPRPVFVAMDRCSVGDGGLAQVTEVCFFPEGSTEGVVVYSTRHGPGKNPYRSKDLYREADLSNGDMFNERLAEEVLGDTIRERDLAGARRFVDAALARVARLPGATDGSTGKPISPAAMNADKWEALLVYRLGLELGEPGFDATVRALEALGAPDAARHCHECKWTTAVLPLYQWLNGRARGGSQPVPDPASFQSGVVGRDPVAISKYLRGDIPEDRFLRQSPNHKFWAGVKRSLGGDKAGARAFFEEFLNTSDGRESGFALGAALSMLSRGK